MCLRKVSVGEIGEGLKGPMKSGHSKNMLSTYIQLLKNKKCKKLQRHLNGRSVLQGIFRNYKHASL